MIPDKFKPHLGNQHNVIKSDVHRGGSVSFKKHLNKPLTDELWEDLVERLNITGLRIYHPNDLQWSLGWPPPSADLELNEDDQVTDITFYPVQRTTPHGRVIHDKEQTKLLLSSLPPENDL